MPKVFSPLVGEMAGRPERVFATGKNPADQPGVPPLPAGCQTFQVLVETLI
jgi:hypothetical protein